MNPPSSSRTAEPDQWVLIVDDDRGVQEVLRAALDTAEVRSQATSLGHDALNLLRDASLRVAIVDLILPDVSGFDVIREIRRRRPDVSILVISGGGHNGQNDPLLKAAERSGAERCFAKPFAVREVTAAVQELLGRSEWPISLRQSQRTARLLSHMQRMAGIGGWELEQRTGKLFWSEEVYRIHEVGSEYKPTLRNALDFYSPEARVRLVAALNQTIHRGEPFDLEAPLQTASGRQIWVRARGEPHPSSHHVERVFGSIQDITEKHQRELALRRTMRSLGDAQRVAQVGCWDWDVAENETWWSGELYRLFHIEPGANLRAWRRRVHREDRRRVLRAFARSLQSGRLSIEFRIAPDATGTIRRVQADGEVIFDAGGQPLRHVGAAVDVTQRRRAEQERDQLLNSSPDLLGVFQIDGRFQRVNPAFSETLGFLEEEMLRKTFLDFVHPDDRDATNAQLAKLRLGGRMTNYPCRALTRDGNLIWLSWSATTAGDERLVFAVARDVTELKNAEREREELRQKLQQSQKLEALGVLAGGIAHDFNNILTSIQGNMEMARLGLGPNAPEAAHLDEAQRASDRARDLVRGILAFGRQSDTERNAIFETAPLVREALELLRPSLPSTIELRTEIAAPGACTRGSRSELHQVVVNLVTNAYQAASQAGSGWIRVSLELQRSSWSPSLLLTVSDSGPGIDPTVADRVFDPFFTTKAPGEGSGLGLAMVHGIVTAHQGTVELRTAPGGGASFEVRLPLAKDPSQEGAPPQVKEAPSRALAAPAKSAEALGRVLLVDDERAIRSLGQAFLKRLGYAPVVCASASEALEQLSEASKEFRAVISDLTMPGLDGLSLSRRVHQMRPALPILLMTGYRQDVTEQDAISAGVVEILYKPFRMQDFAAALERALVGDRGRETA